MTVSKPTDAIAYRSPIQGSCNIINWWANQYEDVACVSNIRAPTY